MTECPKCGYAGIGPCSCEYKSVQPAQLSADGLAKFLTDYAEKQIKNWSAQVGDYPDRKSCMEFWRQFKHYVETGAEAYASAVAQRELPEEKPDTNHPNTSYQLPEKFSKVFKPSPPEADIAATQEEPEK